VLQSGKGRTVDQIELRYQAVQCHVRAQRAAVEADAEWLLELSAKLAHMADVQEQRTIFEACRELLEPAA
jgi:hypothetical protein